MDKDLQEIYYRFSHLYLLGYFKQNLCLFYNILTSPKTNYFDIFYMSIVIDDLKVCLNDNTLNYFLLYGGTNNCQRKYSFIDSNIIFCHLVIYHFNFDSSNLYFEENIFSKLKCSFSDCFCKSDFVIDRSSWGKTYSNNYHNYIGKLFFSDLELFYKLLPLSRIAPCVQIIAPCPRFPPPPLYFLGSDSRFYIARDIILILWEVIA